MQDISTFVNQHALLSLATMLVLLLILILETLKAKRANFNLAPSQAIQLINKQNALFIDTRSTDAFRAGHIIGAQSFPSEDLQKNSKKLEKLKARPLIFISNTPSESQKLAALLLKQGYNAYVLAGGLKAWSEAEMPLMKE